MSADFNSMKRKVCRKRRKHSIVIEHVSFELARKQRRDVTEEEVYISTYDDISHIDELYDDTPFLGRDRDSLAERPLPPLPPRSRRPPLPPPRVRNNTRLCEDFYASESGYTDPDVPLLSQSTPHVSLHNSHKDGPLPCTSVFTRQVNNQYEVHAWNEGDECGEIYHSHQKVYHVLLRTQHGFLHWPLYQ